MNTSNKNSLSEAEHYISVKFTTDCINSIKRHVLYLSMYQTGVGLSYDDAYLTTVRRFKKQTVNGNPSKTLWESCTRELKEPKLPIKPLENPREVFNRKCYGEFLRLSTEIYHSSLIMKDIKFANKYAAERMYHDGRWEECTRS
jgi:hypothetical protein